MEIVPAVLEATATDLIKQLENLRPYFSHFQIDIADGRFVPNRTVQIEDMNNLKFTRLGSPSAARRVTFDFHLMLNDPRSEIYKLNQLADKIKIKTVFIHLQPFKGSAFINLKPKFQFGLVLNPEDEVDKNWAVISDFPIVQIMSVHPGFQGAAFLPETLEKIAQLRQCGFGGKIYLDGGINDQTLPLILKNQLLPDVLCVGSYLKQNPREKLRLLRSQLAFT